MIKRFCIMAAMAAACTTAMAQRHTGFQEPDFLGHRHGASHSTIPLDNEDFALNEYGLHEGMNMEVSTGVAASFGGGQRSGALFYTTVEGCYAHQVNDRLSMAVGGELGYYTGAWGQAATLRAYGLLNYRFSDRANASLYVERNQGNLMGNGNTFLGAPLPGGYYGGYYGPYGYYHPGYSYAYYDRVMRPSTTIGGEFNLLTKRNNALHIGFNFTHYDRNDGGSMVPGMNGVYSAQNTNARMSALNNAIRK